jgi:hypothetical protein
VERVASGVELPGAASGVSKDRDVVAGGDGRWWMAGRWRVIAAGVGVLLVILAFG